MYKHLRILQEKLFKKTVIKEFDKNINLAAGIDVSFSKKDNLAFCSIVVVDKDFNIVEVQNSHKKINMPYIPGLLSFRELPVIYDTYKKLRVKPDIFILDSQGIAHPRKFGLATHFGVVFGVPSIGCAKSKLVGDYVEPELEKGSFSYLYYKNEKLGVVLRSRTKVKPIYVSPGHLTDIESSMRIVMQFVNKYRLPEPTRHAHIYAEKYKRAIIDSN
ncbi:endonuclease V [Deferribacter autotrophicus]|uniref:Endonuclease V n=1 Tax=Deferribacter autotrophicus TaxID=500465 RepID=A0A5A8F434_9BACT|nr:deoxyribonuclease V [Deferribacter autotrophicus]KAA0258221.1 endonuclease V [Deferribacter autotrophicus]